MKSTASYSRYELRVRPGAALLEQLSGVCVSLGFGAGEADPVGQTEIRLASFQADKGMEPTILRWLQRIIAGETGFEVRVNNFGAVPGESIHLRLADQRVFGSLLSKLAPVDEFVRSNGFPPLYAEQRPVLRIAGSQEDHWLRLFSAGEFAGSFELKELLLYSRYAGEDDYNRCAVLPMSPAVTVAC